jgi:hypothetical protein
MGLTGKIKLWNDVKRTDAGSKCKLASGRMTTTVSPFAAHRFKTLCT